MAHKCTAGPHQKNRNKNKTGNMEGQRADFKVKTSVNNEKNIQLNKKQNVRFFSCFHKNVFGNFNNKTNSSTSSSPVGSSLYFHKQRFHQSNCYLSRMWKQFNSNKVTLMLLICLHARAKGFITSRSMNLIPAAGARERWVKSTLKHPQRSKMCWINLLVALNHPQ